MSRPASYLQARAQRIEVHVHAHEAGQSRREAVLLEVGVDIERLALRARLAQLDHLRGRHGRGACRVLGSKRRRS